MKFTQNKKLNSLAVKTGVIISLVLLIILGLKATFDIRSTYTKTIQSGESHKVEEAKKLSSMLESNMTELYDVGSYTQSVVQKMINDVPVGRRKKQRDYYRNNYYYVSEKSQYADRSWCIL